MRPILSEILKINDSSQKIALGFGLGVFSGIFPGTGPLAAVFLSFIFRANYLSALLGSILTNTWLSVVTFLLAIKVGAVIMGVNWQDAQREWNFFLKNFQWAHLIKLSVLKVVFPVFLGYLLIACFAGLFSYLLVLIILKLKKRGSVILITLGCFLLSSLSLTLLGCSTTETVTTIASQRSQASGWINGQVSQDLDATFSKVVPAALQALEALQLNITKTEIAKDAALIIGEYVDNKTIWIDLRRISERATHLEIRVSVQGNKEASFLILEKIKSIL
jgi:uncharacterized protein (DUF2062 family)